VYNQMDETSGMRLDMSAGEGNELYENRELHTLNEINDVYGPPAVQKSSSNPFYFSYFKYLGGCLSVVFSCGPKVCPKTCVEIPQGYVGLKKEAGAFIGKLRPGIHRINPFLHTIDLVEIRAQTLTLPHQYVLSKDNVAFEIDAVINFRVVFPEVSHFKITNYYAFVLNVAQSALKSVISENTFSNLLSQREKINKETMAYMELKLEQCGLELDLVETLNIRLSSHLETVLAVVAESENRAKSKVIDAIADLETSKSFAQAAAKLEENTISVMLQKWEILHQIGQHNCQTVVVPHDLLGRLSSAFEDEPLKKQETPSTAKTPFD
jgi:hypothetical protein